MSSVLAYSLQYNGHHCSPVADSRCYVRCMPPAMHVLDDWLCLLGYLVAPVWADSTMTSTTTHDVNRGSASDRCMSRYDRPPVVDEAVAAAGACPVCRPVDVAPSPAGILALVIPPRCESVEDDLIKNAWNLFHVGPCSRRCTNSALTQIVRLPGAPCPAAALMETPELRRTHTVMPRPRRGWSETNGRACTTVAEADRYVTSTPRRAALDAANENCKMADIQTRRPPRNETTSAGDSAIALWRSRDQLR